MKFFFLLGIPTPRFVFNKERASYFFCAIVFTIEKEIARNLLNLTRGSIENDKVI